VCRSIAGPFWQVSGPAKQSSQDIIHCAWSRDLGARFELGCKPQTAIADNAAALPLIVAKRFEFACELWQRKRLVVFASRTSPRRPRAARPLQGKTRWTSQGAAGQRQRHGSLVRVRGSSGSSLREGRRGTTQPHRKDIGGRLGCLPAHRLPETHLPGSGKL